MTVSILLSRKQRMYPGDCVGSVRSSVRPSVRLSVCQSVCQSVRLSVRLCVSQSVCLSVCPFVRLSVRPSVSQSAVRLSAYFLQTIKHYACAYARWRAYTKNIIFIWIIYLGKEYLNRFFRICKSSELTGLSDSVPSLFQVCSESVPRFVVYSASVKHQAIKCVSKMPICPRSCLSHFSHVTG